MPPRKAAEHYGDGFLPVPLHSSLVCRPRLRPTRPLRQWWNKIVPVFYIGATGGLNTLGLYTLTLLGSEDVTHYIVTLTPGSPAIDYGHGDLFNASNAKSVVWSKILAWLKNHDDDNSCSGD